MRTVRLAYRDRDRTPMIYCIKAMAERHYGVNIEVIQIEPQKEFEAALFNHSCDVIIEHIEYLHTEAAKGQKITLFCAPQIQRGLQLVVPPDFNSLADLKGKSMAVRDLGRPHRITLWLRKVGLENEVRTFIVPDKEIGRWKQWKKVVRGECAACFIAPIYLADALAAGLKTFPASEAEVVSLFAQACLSEFAAQNSDLLKNYLKAVIHALALFKYRRDEAVAIATGEPMRLMKLTDGNELRSQVNAMAELLQIKPYPTVEAIVNTDDIAAQEYGPTAENPLALWDLHWVKELDDEGFIDDLVARLS